MQSAPGETRAMLGSSLGVTKALKAVAGGIGFVVGTPAVWGYALVPVTVLLVLACGLTVLGIWGASWITDALLGRELGLWGQAGSWLLTLVLGAVAVLVALLLALVLAQPLSGFALEKIVRAQEWALTGEAPHAPSILAAFLMSARIALVTLVVGGPVLGGLFVIGFVFAPAAVVTVPLKFLVGAWLLAWDFLDYPLGLRGLGLWARLRWVRRNFAAFTAFGLAWAALLLVPGIFLLVLPMGVAGAARLVVADERLHRPYRIQPWP